MYLYYIYDMQNATDFILNQLYELDFQLAVISIE